jgi:hypothetical protein
MHLSLASALTEATPMACAALLYQGITHIVCVETRTGAWTLLHAESVSHAHNLAHAWVDNMGARGASVRRIYKEGPHNKPCFSLYEQLGMEDA